VFKRQRSGSALCTSCGSLVGVNDETCYNCGRRNPTMWGFAPVLRALGGDMGFVPFTIGASAIAYALMLLYSGGAGLGNMNPLQMFSPSGEAVRAFGASGAVPVFVFGHWWTLLSASWLHGGALHILFNMMWVRQLAPAAADLYGPGRAVIIYVVAGIAGFALSSFAGAFLPRFPFLAGSSFTLGASASIFGLLGALVYYGRRTGSSVVGSQAASSALMLGLFGLIMPGVDNYAHGGGFAGGYLMALLLDPMKPERIDHIAIAVACLAASILAIVYNFFIFARLA
jgi:rhomboid protease GluP